jgi:hypothetical protein
MCQEATRTRLHQKKLIAPSCDIVFPSFLAWIEWQESKLRKKVWVLKLRAREIAEKVKMCQGATRTRLYQKKLIAPSCDIGFPSFLAWIERQQSRLRNGRRKFGFRNSRREKRLKKWGCVRIEEGTDQDEASPEKAHSFPVRYRISEFFCLNWIIREQATQWQKKVWILKLRARESAEKVKMC